MKQEKEKCCDNRSIVGIAPALAGIFIPVTMFVVIFTPAQATAVLPAVAAAFAVLGIGVAYFASKK